MISFRSLKAAAIVILFPSLAAAGELRVCVASSPPFMIQKEGRVNGIEYDILSTFAEAQGLKLQLLWKESFTQVLPSLEEGECDIASAMVTPTEDRAKRFDFSQSYFPARMVLIQVQGKGVASLDELTGKKVVTIKGTTYEDVLKKVKDVTLMYRAKHSDLALLTVSGEADAFICDSGLAVTLLESYPTLHISLMLSRRDPYVFALQQGSRFTQPLNELMMKIKKDDTYEKILLKYMDKETLELILRP